MKIYDQESELARYVWNHFRHLFTSAELKAGLAVYANEKGWVGSPRIRGFIWKQHQLAEDAEVMKLLEEGEEVFRRRAAERVVREHAGEVFINRCGRCRRIVRTPKAKQCLWCGYDWH